MHSTEEKKKKRTNETVGDKKESQAIDNRFTARIMLEQRKQTGCYLTEEERMKLVAHGTPFWERGSQAAWLGSVLWCVYNVQGGYRETGYDKGLAPEMWMPSQTGRALDDRGHFLQSEPVSRFRRVACENTPIDLKHCRWLEMHPAGWGPSRCGDVWPTAGSGPHQARPPEPACCSSPVQKEQTKTRTD